MLKDQGLLGFALLTSLAPGAAVAGSFPGGYQYRSVPEITRSVAANNAGWAAARAWGLTGPQGLAVTLRAGSVLNESVWAVRAPSGRRGLVRCLRSYFYHSKYSREFHQNCALIGGGAPGAGAPQ